MAAQARVAEGRDGVDGQVQEANHGQRTGEHDGGADAPALVPHASGIASATRNIAAIAAITAPPDHALVGVRLVAQPGVAAPGEPQQGEQHQPAEDAAPAEVVGHEAR